MASKPVWEQIGAGFVQHYYQQFDSDRTKLADLYVSIFISTHLEMFNGVSWTNFVIWKPLGKSQVSIPCILPWDYPPNSS